MDERQNTPNVKTKIKVTPKRTDITTTTSGHNSGRSSSPATRTTKSGLHLKQWLKTGEVSELYGVNAHTVRRWQQQGKIPAIKAPSGQRLFDRQSIETCLHETSSIQEDSEAPTTKRNFLYSRVSSRHQADDLQRQSSLLKSRYPNYELLEDIGSGINWKRKGLHAILDTALQGNLGQVVVNSPKAKFALLTFISFFQIFRKMIGRNK